MPPHVEPPQGREGFRRLAAVAVLGACCGLATEALAYLTPFPRLVSRLTRGGFWNMHYVEAFAVVFPMTIAATAVLWRKKREWPLAGWMLVGAPVGYIAGLVAFLGAVAASDSGLAGWVRAAKTMGVLDSLVSVALAPVVLMSWVYGVGACGLLGLALRVFARRLR